MKKVPQISTQEAAQKVKSGDVIIAGGFGMTGNPVHLLNALAETDVNDLTSWVFGIFVFKIHMVIYK